MSSKRPSYAANGNADEARDAEVGGCIAPFDKSITLISLIIWL